MEITTKRNLSFITIILFLGLAFSPAIISIENKEVFTEIFFFKYICIF